MKKKLKSIACLLVSAVMLLSFAPASFADGETGAAAETDSEIVEMYAIGVLPDAPDKDFRPDDMITRGEFAEWLACAGMLEAHSSKAAFADVPEESPYAASIAALAENGIVDGSGGGTFRPDSDITIAEAVKCVIGLLDFKEAAERYGGYPDGYLRLASDAKLLKGVETSDDGHITRRNAAVLIYNMMFENVYKMEVSGGNVKYTVDKDTTFLYKTRKLVKMTDGIVTVNAVTDLNGGSGGQKGYVTIGDTVFEDPSGSAKELIGRKVDYYYTDRGAGDCGELAYIARSSKTETVTVSSEDIDAYENNVLKIFKGSKSSKLNISPEVDVIVNGKVLDYSKNDIEFRDDDGSVSRYGTIELADNDNDGKYDLMDVHSYYNIIVSYVRDLDEGSGAAQHDYEIIDKNGKTVKISENISYSIKDRSGGDIPLSSLKEFDVLAVAESSDHENIEMVYCDEAVTGEVTGIGTDDEKYIVTIDGAEYTILRKAGFYSPSQSEDSLGLEAGDKAFFTLDLGGNIALVKDKSVNTGDNYGLIIDYCYDDSKSDILIKILRNDGNIVLMTAARRITVDELSYKSADKLFERLTEVSRELNGTDAAGRPLRKEFVVKYALNSEGYVRNIDTPYINEPGSGEDEQSLHMMSLRRESDEHTAADPVSLIYRANTFGGRIVVTSDTLFFYMPPANDISDDKYAVLPSSMLKIDSDHNIQAYITNTSSQIPEAVLICASPVYTKNVQEIDKGTDINIYLKKIEAVDEEGEPKNAVVLFQNGREITKCVESEDVENFKELTPGDVIRFGTNSSANIDRIDVVYKRDTNKLPRQGLANDASLTNNNILFTNGGARAVFGGVYGKEDNIIAVVNQIKKYQESDTTGTDDGILVNDNMADLSLAAKSSIERYDISSYQIYRFNGGDKPNVQTVTVNDVMAYQETYGNYDYALVYTMDYRPGIIILYSSNEVVWDY